MPNRADLLRDRIQVELVRSLFGTIAPAVIMSAAFVLSGLLLCSTSSDPGLVALGIVGSIASIVRLSVVLRCRDEAEATDLSIIRAKALEQQFTLSYLAFAVTLGLFGARALTVIAAAEAHMLMICLLVGYAAGVAAGVGLRPRLAIPSMICAIVPAIIVTISGPNWFYLATGVMLAALLSGGIHSMLERNKAAT